MAEKQPDIASISSGLARDFGVEIAPGRRGQCPFCKHDNFTIKATDDIAHCWSGCQRWLTQRDFDPSRRFSMQAVLREVYRDFHAHLARHADALSELAYKYLAETRRVHADVISDALIGCIPRSYDALAKFKQAFDWHVAETARLRAEQTRIEGDPATTPDAKFEAAQLAHDASERHKRIASDAQKLQNLVQSLTGWLAFFYTDANHEIIFVKFREPHGKKILCFKPIIPGQFKNGVFGANLYAVAARSRAVPDDRLVVTEGEFNALAIQSLLKNTGSGYAFVCATGGSTGSDFDTINRLSKKPIYIHDNDEPGLKMIEEARALAHVSKCTTPAPHKDVDEYIAGFDGNHNAALAGLQALIASATVEYRNFDSICAEVDAVRRRRRGDSRRDNEVNLCASRVVADDMAARGTLHYDPATGTAYFFFTADKILIPLHRESQPWKNYCAKYNINPTDMLFRYLTEHVCGLASAEYAATGAQICCDSHYDTAQNVLRVFNYAGVVYRVSADSVEAVHNGDGGILFLASPRMEKFEIEVRTATENPTET